MKTKRIVALALATAIAVGGVTPAFAETLNTQHAEKWDQLAYENFSNKFTNAYQKQKELVDKAKEDWDAAVAARDAAITDRDEKFAAYSKAQTNVDLAQRVVDRIKQNQEAHKKTVADKKVDYSNAKINYTTGTGQWVGQRGPEGFGEAPLANIEAYEAKEQDFKDKEEPLWHELVEAAKAKGELDKDADGPTSSKWLVDNSKEWQDFSAAKMKLSYEKADYIANIQPLYDEIKTLAATTDELEKALRAAETDLSYKKLLLTNATADFNAAKIAEAAAIQDAKNKSKAHSEEEDHLVAMRTIQKTLTKDYIENHIAPQIGNLAVENVMKWVFAELDAEGYFSMEVYKAAGLPANVLNGYADILGDAGEVEDPDESKDESKTEDPKEPEKPTEESKTNPEENKKPVNPEKPAEESTNKKEDKKVQSKKNPKTGDIALLTYATSAVLAAGAFVASKKRK